jgi:hypothetical protein
MSTLHGIREFALAATLATGVLVASAAPACEERMTEHSSVVLIADLGRMTVSAPRDADVADLGSLTVTARRHLDSFADLGSMTVTASRLDTIRVADLGSLTVTATRIDNVVVAARHSDRSFE